jgi:hypothetical protein
VRHLVAGARQAYMRDMSRKALFVVVFLAVILIAAIYLTTHMWTSIDSTSGGGSMNGNGVAALVIGGIGSLVLGGGLMALVFFSSRRGYDDAADFKRDSTDP